MNVIPGSIAAWVAAAVLLFWVVGAYNRLMRLRADAVAAFATLVQDFGQQIELVRTRVPATDPTQPAPLVPEPGIWSALQAAAAQFAASVAAARQRPFDRGGIAALAAARDVLATAWERAERDDAHDLAGSRLPDDVLKEQAQLALRARGAADQFDRAVLRYNAAIGQFPAMLLALVFGFRPGRPFAAQGAAA